MSQEEVNRKLSCILSTDVVGYSRLMEENEASTVRYLEENKKLISGLIEERNGRVVDSPGDNLLAEFSSAVKAVDCAVKIQKELKIKNAELIETRRMQFRIGINLGDVIEENGRLYGSGVNIAARLEGLAEPGGICISRNVYDQVKTKLDIGCEYLGEHDVKNISEPVRIYRVKTGVVIAGNVVNKKVHGGLYGKISIAATLLIIIAGLLVWRFYPNHSIKIEQASIAPGTEPLTSDSKEALKSIAVLPFDDFSPEKDQEYFVNGLSEEILNAIAQIPGLKVIARTSSFSFKGTNKKIQEIAGELGVYHILEGSIRKAGNAIRITAQLIKADDGSHLWSKAYNKELNVEEMFAIQEDIARAVANELKLTFGVEKSPVQLGGTENMKAYEYYLVAVGQANKAEWEGAFKSITTAIELDPEFADAWLVKGVLHAIFATIRSPDQISVELDACRKAAMTANKLEPGLGASYILLGSFHSIKLDFIEAQKKYQKGIELTTDPSVLIGMGLGVHYIVVGYLRKFKDLIEKGIQIDPLDSGLHENFILVLGFLGDMERAEEEYKRWKPILGNMWSNGSEIISLLRPKTKDEFPVNEIFDIPAVGRINAIGVEHLKSPQEGIAKLGLLYKENNRLTIIELGEISIWAAYFGDPEFALNAIERSARYHNNRLSLIWAPVMKEVRQLPRFKEYVREIGLVDYWKQYGWPDLCHPVGDDDFECD